MNRSNAILAYAYFTIDWNLNLSYKWEKSIGLKMYNIHVLVKKSNLEVLFFWNLWYLEDKVFYIVEKAKKAYKYAFTASKSQWE